MISQLRPSCLSTELEQSIVSLNDTHTHTLPLLWGQSVYDVYEVGHLSLSLWSQV